LQSTGRLREGWNPGLTDAPCFAAGKASAPLLRLSLIVVAPNPDGFGSVLTERSIIGQLGGKIEYDWQRSGLKLRMTVPGDRRGSGWS
jgi:hypothetical protein